ncbi:MAG: low molecular weight phosphotyrosine protein phosphatase [Chlamydiia bacterium]|nr:low molecular weight phosphotyrosine protein phosphatase [Chlamydiia bacterium]
MKHVLFVCLGNICRSPAGEAILRRLAEEEGVVLTVDSCGTGDWHVGQEAHHKMRAAAEKRGFQLNGRAKQFEQGYYDRFDLILAAEEAVYKSLMAGAASEEQKSRIHMMTAYSEPYRGQNVPDPYFGGDEHFEETLDILEEICRDILDHVRYS